MLCWAIHNTIQWRKIEEKFQLFFCDIKVNIFQLDYVRNVWKNGNKKSKIIGKIYIWLFNSIPFHPFLARISKDKTKNKGFFGKHSIGTGYRKHRHPREHTHTLPTPNQTTISEHTNIILSHLCKYMFKDKMRSDTLRNDYDTLMLYLRQEQEPKV